MRFRVRALGGDSSVVSVVLDAADAGEARRLAEAGGMRVLSLRPERALAGLRRPDGRFPLALFSEELATLLAAGLALVDALESLAERERDEATARVLHDLVRQLREGKSLSQAMGSHPAIFPELYLALLGSGEQTGGLAAALARYVAYRARIDHLRQRLASAALYPVLLMGVGGSVVLFLLIYVVPRFSVVFDGLPGELPWHTALLLEFGRVMAAHRGAVIGVLGGLAVAAAVAVRRPALRSALLGAVLSVGPLRERMRIFRLAGFYRATGILLQGGVALIPAMGMARGLLGAELGARLEAAVARVREGIRLSAALEAAEMAPPVAARLVRAGERSGDLGSMLERAADFHEQELARWIERFARLFEPLLMTVIGVVIGAIVLLMYLPIFELASSIE